MMKQKTQTTVISAVAPMVCLNCGQTLADKRAAKKFYGGKPLQCQTCGTSYSNVSAVSKALGQIESKIKRVEKSTAILLAMVEFWRTRALKRKSKSRG